MVQKTPVSSMRSLSGLLKAYWVSDSWKEAWLLTLVVAALSAAASKSGVWLAEASGAFISAIASFHDTDFTGAAHTVLLAAGVLGGLAFMKLAVFLGFRHLFAATLHKRWRAWLDRQFNAALLSDRRAYYHLLVLGQSADDAPSNVPDNIDQRIQESIKVMTGNALGMAMGAVLGGDVGLFRRREADLLVGGDHRPRVPRLLRLGRAGVRAGRHLRAAVDADRHPHPAG